VSEARADTSPGQSRLLDEITEQPRVVARVLDRQRAVLDVANAIRRRPPKVIVLVARGSSDNAAVYGRYLFEIRNRHVASLAAPSAVTLYGSGPRLADALVIGVSQSGQGEDVVAYVREARAQGGTTVAVVNDATSPLAAAAEWVLDCQAGPELSVPATKSVTGQMALLASLSAALAEGEAGVRALAPLPEAINRALALRDAARALARVLAQATLASVIGRGFAYPAALEIALKLKETSQSRAEPFSAADFLHGPVALVDSDYAALLVDVGGRSTRPALATAGEVQRRGGQPFLLRAGEIGSPPADTPGLALDVPVPEPYAPIVALVLGQLLAMELALARGLDPAHPRGLRKVTSTR
jgi:glucosamine--fructose-6-phosphate aminotransferase (isomerizing)